MYPVRYSGHLEIRQTDEYRSWFVQLRDHQARARINVRLRKIGLSGRLTGDFKVFDRLIELRFDFGPGYRIYATRRGDTLMLLLVGGDKSTQSADIARARRMAQEWRNQQ
jgi:putative addiction module killer protein